MRALLHTPHRYALGDSLGKGDADGCARAVACLSSWAAAGSLPWQLISGPASAVAGGGGGGAGGGAGGDGGGGGDLGPLLAAALGAGAGALQAAAAQPASPSPSSSPSAASAAAGSVAPLFSAAADLVEASGAGARARGVPWPMDALEALALPAAAAAAAAFALAAAEVTATSSFSSSFGGGGGGGSVGEVSAALARLVSGLACADGTRTWLRSGSAGAAATIEALVAGGALDAARSPELLRASSSCLESWRRLDLGRRSGGAAAAGGGMSGGGGSGAVDAGALLGRVLASIVQGQGWRVVDGDGDDEDEDDENDEWLVYVCVWGGGSSRVLITQFLFPCR